VHVFEGPGGLSFQGENRLHAGEWAKIDYKASVPFNGPRVELTDRMKEGRVALVDTSSAENWAALETAAALGMVPLSPPALAARPIHVTDSVDGLLCISQSLRLDTLRADSILFFVRASRDGLGVLARGLEKPAPAFVLGMRFLTEFSFVRFDVTGRTIVFMTDVEYKPDARRLLGSVPLDLRDGVLAVKGAVNGEPLPILLDSAGNYDVVIPGEPAGSVRQLSMGDIVLRNLPQQSGEALEGGLSGYPRAGLGIFSRFIITLDNRRGVVHFERRE